MKFEFISNACGIFTSKSGKRILTDPWIVDGVFEGSWCHFHKLNTTLDDLQSVDAIYLSHIHPDHYDPRYFNFRKDIPIVVLDHGLNYLHKNLMKQGYSNLIKVKDGEMIKFEDFKLWLFAPFVKHKFFSERAPVGNLIDSAIIVENNGIIAFNANDNAADIKACQMIEKKFGKINLAMMTYNNAGPYPSCFNNLTKEEKLKERIKLLNKNFDYLFKNLQVLKPKYFLPFAGSYVLGGRLHLKNKYLSTSTWDECASYLEKKINFGTQVVCLRENDIFDLEQGVSDKNYIPIDVIKMKEYIKKNLSTIVYEYEKEPFPSIVKIKDDLKIAKLKMLDRCKKIKLVPDMDIEIKLEKEIFKILSLGNSKGVINCSLDTRLLRRILDRKANWNNAEIGCHIEFIRKPNYYSPDMHTVLQLLHL